jgi:hypothetical protein
MTVFQYATIVRNTGVHNLSSQPLSLEMKTILAHGHQFIPAPKNNVVAQRQQLLNSFEKLLRGIKIKYLFRDRPDKPFNKNIYIPKTGWNPPKQPGLDTILDDLHDKFKTFVANDPFPNSNSPINETLPIGYRKIIKLFTKDQRFTIRNADKGLGMTICDRDWYINECYRQLRDATTYKELKFEQGPAGIRILLNKTRAEATQLVLKLQHITAEHKNFILHHLQNPERTFGLCAFHGLPKIHKLNPLEKLDLTKLKIRPIASNMSSITLSLSIVVDDALKECMLETKSYIRDSTDYIKHLATITLPQSRTITLAAFDVESLYPNIPTSFGLELIEKYLASKYPGKMRLFHDILTLLRFVLTHSFISFNKDVFLQIDGTSMGTPASVVYANLFMAALEDDWITKFGHKIISYKRFIDDGAIIFDATIEEANLILSEFNALHEKIKITTDVSQTSIVFLDLCIYLDTTNNKLLTKPFQKPMNQYLYIPYTSYHHRHMMKGWITGELKRYIRLSSRESDFLEIRKKFYDRLSDRGYPSSFTLPLFNSITYEIRETLLAPQDLLKSNNLVMVIERNALTERISTSRFLTHNWFDSSIDPNQQGNLKICEWLRNLPKPTLATTYTSNLGQILMRTDVNAFDGPQDPFFRTTPRNSLKKAAEHKK